LKVLAIVLIVRIIQIGAIGVKVRVRVRKTSWIWSFSMAGKRIAPLFAPSRQTWECCGKLDIKNVCSALLLGAQIVR
jgi:hypothetical protein